VEIDTTKDTSTIDTTGFEVIGTSTWEVGFDTLKTGSEGITSGTKPVLLELTKGTGDDAWISASTYLDTTLVGVKSFLITYTSDKAFNLSLGTDTNGFVYSLPAGTNVTKQVKPSDFSLSWGTGTLDLANFWGPAIEATETGKTSVSISSLKLAGFVGGSTVDTTDTTSDTTKTDTTTTGTGFDVLGTSDWEISADTLKTGSAGTATGTKPVEIVLTKGTDVASLGDDGYAWVGAAMYLDTTLEGVTEIEITYTSDKELALGLSTDSYGYTATLASGTNVKKVLKISDFANSWGTAALNLAEITGIALEATADSATNVSVSVLKLFGYKGATSVLMSAKKISSTLAITGIVGNQMNLSVPTAGRYEISLYSLNGQKLGAMSSTLAAGSASVNLDGMNLASRMVIVQIAGTKMQSVHKVMIK